MVCKTNTSLRFVGASNKSLIETLIDHCENELPNAPEIFLDGVDKGGGMDNFIFIQCDEFYDSQRYDYWNDWRVVERRLLWNNVLTPTMIQEQFQDRYHFKKMSMSEIYKAIMASRDAIEYEMNKEYYDAFK
jgi:hypothetical protein